LLAMMATNRGRRALHVQLERRQPVLGECIEHARDLLRDPRAHQHVVDR
jgi:hypothetical protein